MVVCTYSFHTATPFRCLLSSVSIGSGATFESLEKVRCPWLLICDLLRFYQTGMTGFVGR